MMVTKIPKPKKKKKVGMKGSVTVTPSKLLFYTASMNNKSLK